MSFILRIFLTLLILLFVEFYFYRKLFVNLLLIYPKLSAIKVKKSIWIFVSLINLYPIVLLVYYFYTAYVGIRFYLIPDNSWFDYLLVYPFWINVFIVAQVLIILLPLDLIKLGLRIKFSSDLINKFFSKITIILILFSALYVPIRVVYDYNTVSVRLVKYVKENLPETLNNFTITFISDIQADKYTDDKRLSNFIDKINSTKPDLVLIAGDLITGTPNYINKSAQYVGKINAKYGVYSCIGDHDNWAYRGNNNKSIKEITDALAKQDVDLINNKSLSIKKDSTSIGITFITYTYAQKASDKIIKKLTSEQNANDLNILLTHQPRQHILDEAIKNKFDLFLSGHTHGGQITFLFPFYNLSPTMFETKYVRGDFQFGDLLMIVTRGLGMSLVPLRYNSTPEVTVIRFIKDN